MAKCLLLAQGKVNFRSMLLPPLRGRPRGTGSLPVLGFSILGFLSEEYSIDECIDEEVAAVRFFLAWMQTSSIRACMVQRMLMATTQLCRVKPAGQGHTPDGRKAFAADAKLGGCAPRRQRATGGVG